MTLAMRTTTGSGNDWSPFFVELPPERGYDY